MTTQTRTRQGWLLAMLQAVLLAWLVPQAALADNFLQNSNNYSATIVGTDKVQFTLPTQMWSSFLNEGITNGQVQISIDGGSYQSFIDWNVPNYRDINGKESEKIKIKGYLGGTYQVTGKVTGGYKTFSTDAIEFTVSCDDNDEDHFTTTVVWTAPRNLRGCKLTFRCWTKSEDRDYTYYMPSKDGWKTLLTWDCPPAAAVSVQLGEPMLAYDGEHVNQQMFTYSVQARSIVWAKLYYTDALTGQKYTQDLDKSKLVGTLYIPADRPWRDVYVEAHVYDAEGKEVDINIKSEARTTLMMHYPQDFFASIDNTGNALLTWSINNADLEDMLDGDYFEIQRNVSGSNARIDPNWVTITAAIRYEQGKRRYSYTDESLLSQYQGKAVTYRIRRTYTGMWQWAEQSGCATCQVNSLMALPAIASATVKKTDTWNDDSHVVQIAYNLTQSEGSKQDATGRYLLNTEEDFADFAALVNGGQTSLNAIMHRDIDISAIKAMIGNSEHPYKGTFDGNGHTLTVGYSTSEQVTAPIRYAAGATIKNLHVAGKLTSSAKNVAGIVGICSSGTNTISNCRVSATIDSSINGDATNGGFVAYNVGSSTLNITDCLFDGRFTGSNCHSNGGFVGFNDGNVNLKNCLYNGRNNTSLTNCNTFARSRDASKVTLTNCYYNDIYQADMTYNSVYLSDGRWYVIIRSSDDWYSFCSMVNSSKGNSDMNAILAADIETSTSCGSSSAPYRGIFDGNGHTIKIFRNSSETYTALFNVVANCTIKNLHVNASILGDIHSAGLIGGVNGSPTVNIYRCWVSGSITSTSDHVGGIFGHTGSCTVNLEDCLFDGSLYASGDSYAGAILGWGAYEAHWNVSRVYEHGNYPNISHAGFCYYYNWGPVAWGNGTLCVSSHGWGEVNSSYRNQTNQNSVANLMNGNKSNSWKVQDSKAVPVMDAERTFLNATGIWSMGSSSLVSKLGGQWQVVNNTAVPKMTQTEPTTGNTTVWDKRARLLLRVNMHGENGIDRKLIDLTENEDATQKHSFTQELSRKCVDYSFDLILRRGSSPLPILNTTTDSLLVSVKKTETGDNANYKFLNSNRITKITPVQRQSSVELTWETSGGDHDFFRILRRKHSTDANARWTDTIATNLDQLYYEDKTVLVQQSYDYRIESVYQCEGTHVESEIASGASCVPTGMIDGYVRMADGTAMAGVTVECRPGSDVKGASALYTAKTDDTGYYVFSGLPYQTNGTYYVTVPTTGDRGSYTSPNAQGQVSFTTSSNWTEDFNFFLDTYYIYSGNVYYRNTSIPVPGVSFRLDGEVMHDASRQPIVTDTQGAFELSIPKGAHTVQAVKDGHHFANDGFLINHDAVGDSTLYNFVQNVSSVYLWDSTTVVLRGRVVGGDVEGSKVLGLSQSKNNLGDSLKIVMQLEGDNTSWLIRRQDDESVKTASYKVAFGMEDKDTTRVDITRHVMTIRPDAKTGEYQLLVPPVKYKVTEVSAEGYATLFQQGKVGETIDLTFQQNGDTCEYSRIYHAVPTVEVQQFNAKSEPYFGVKQTTAADNIGNKAEMQLWSEAAGYAFGYPVFMAGSPYGWMLQACEKYYRNNDSKAVPDIVNLRGGTVSIKNLMVSSDGTEQDKTIELDEQGYGSYVFTPANVTTVLEGEDALKSVDITLKYDGNYYDVFPLDGKIMRGYVMATTPKAEGTYTVAANYPQLIDILRDPPGSGSSSYIEAGSKLSYTYSPTFEGTLGVALSSVSGTTTTTYYGTSLISTTTGIGNHTGTVSEAHSEKTFGFSLASTYNGSWVTSYEFDVNERIQTRTGQKWVGPDADLFMGTNEQLIIQDAIAVRVIPEDQYQLMKTHEGGSFPVSDDKGHTTTVNVKVGSMKVLAQGHDAATGKNVYLVRDEVLGMRNQVKSTFIHSQHYIEKELLPQLVKLRNSLADDTQSANQVKDLNQQIGYWLNMLAQNEEEKVNVLQSNLVKNYDIDGGVASLQYSENFAASRNKSGFIKWPGLDNANIANLFPSWAWEPIKEITQLGEDAAVGQRDDPDRTLYLQAAVAGSEYKIKFTPILSFNFSDKSSENKAQTKKVGFTLSASPKSSLNVDVYRTRNGKYAISEDDYQKNDTVYDEMLKMTVDVLKELRYGQPYHPAEDIEVYSNFVFRTRGGTTNKPYEGERTTKWYQPGTVIDVATVPLDKPSIWIEQPVVSNVPFNEPARYVVHMANESAYPDQASYYFMYYLESDCNPKGAKVCVDGKVINSSDEPVYFTPVVDPVTGKPNVITKEITVYPSTSYDYEDLAISLYDPDDLARVATAKFSAHFIPSAGKVNVSVPGDNWVMNTESPYNGKRQAYYMPVRIDGFDVNFPGFDHIELQYKLSTQGDKDWVSTCAYYQDKELMKKASGVTDTIPDNGIIVAPFYGEVDPVEQYYDIRAVNYCRYAGGYLTQASPILKGIKDTRLPELFGTPEPINGILGIGDDLKLTFSEPIAGNYLSKINNFELLGTPLSTDISTSTSVTFDGQLSLAYTQGRRNLKGKSFSVDVMLNPGSEAREMAVFNHGGKTHITFGLSADRHLTATVNGETVQSDQAVPFNGMLRQVVYTLDQQADSMTLSFYDGSQQIGSQKLPGIYDNDNSSNIYIGYDFSDEQRPYKGDMLEMRLWNHALTASDIAEYGQRTLTGYESGLQDYYPMTEGSGDFCYDKAPGSMDLRLVSTAWKRPDGLALKLDGTKGLRLKPDKFLRTKDHDYTLMFWFRPTGGKGTLFANGEATADSTATDRLNIGLEDAQLYVRSDGWQQTVSGYLLNNEWHHFAMTVSRSRNVANVYVDQKLTASFAADSLAGIASDHVALGATYADKNTPTDVLTGNIDEVAMFESVLPLKLINEFTTHTPIGSMTALMAYLNFEQSVRLDDNTMHLEPTGVSLKRYKDNQGNTLARRDTLVSSIEADMVDRTLFAPMVSTSQLQNLNFNYVANDNQLIVNIKEPDYAIEKTNVYLTVKELPDLQGNLMASPVTMNVYVYRNPLRWGVKRISQNIRYGEGLEMDVTVQNLSGQRQNYELEDLPVWITASQTSGIIDALGEETITLTVSPYINIGTYDEQITLVGESAMSEPLPVTLKVRGEAPAWAVSDRLKQANQTMMMVARVKIDGVVASSTEDVLGVFDDRLQTLGVAHIEVDNTANANEALAYVTIYGYTNPNGTTPALSFKFYDASKGQVVSVQPADGGTYRFQKDVTVGSATAPVELDDNYNDMQTLPLKKGWNWITFTVQPTKGTTTRQFLDSNSLWEAGDIIMAVDGTETQQWTCRAKSSESRGYLWDHAEDSIKINSARMYSIYSMSDKTIYLEGFNFSDSVKVHQGWNRIAYQSNINLPIEQALSDYIEKASEGDIVKSQDAFAVASRTANGLVWKGSLKYMETGKGYMMKRLSDEKVAFNYPQFYGSSRYAGNNASKARRISTATTMNIVATVSGIDTEEGDRLVAYCGTDRVAEAVADSEQNYYLSIGECDKTLAFAIERDGELVAMTSSQIGYKANQVVGSPEEPTDISFVRLDEMPQDGNWYTIAGIRLGKKPAVSGLYIHDGKVVIIKK